MSSASSCTLDSTVLLRGVSITPRLSPYAESDVTVVGMMRSPRLMPFTTISSRSPVEAAAEGAADCCACAVWKAMRIENDVTTKTQFPGVTTPPHPFISVHPILAATLGQSSTFASHKHASLRCNILGRERESRAPNRGAILPTER